MSDQFESLDFSDMKREHQDKLIDFILDSMGFSLINEKDYYQKDNPKLIDKYGKQKDFT